MIELLRKTHRLEIVLKDGKEIFIDIKQGSLRELIEMSDSIKTENDLRKWLSHFLVKKSKPSDNIKVEDFSYLMPNRVVEIIDWLMDTFAKGYFKKVKKSDNDKKKKKVEKDVESPSSAMICYVLKETGESLESLLELTWEQIEYLIEGSIWNKNAETKEGQKINKRNLAKKQMREKWTDDEALKIVRDMEEKLKSGKIKFDDKNKKTTRIR
jgi:hypothetical protein